MRVEFLRAQREKRFALLVNDPQPVEDVAGVWTSAAQMATIGIFVLLLLVCLYFSRALLVPILTAVIIAITFGPLVNKAADHGIPRWVTSLVLVGTIMGVAALGITLLANPLTEWIARAPEVGATIRQKLHVFDAPLAAVRELQSSLTSTNANQVKVESGLAEWVTPAIAILTPAATQAVVFVVTLIFFSIGQLQFRNVIISLLPSRDAKLRYLKIVNDVGRNLAGYLTVVTLINVALGVVVALGAWLLGFPDPVFFGLLAAILNYIPYIGPAIMVAVLFTVGLVVFPTVGDASIAPLAFVALATLEGMILTPTIVGRHLTLNPLAVFLAVAFWAWLWGPFGAFLAVPLSIVGLVTMNHLFPDENPALPD
jgi:predicted PurR-regulated permease PerM